jgi:hypothetical protein
MKIIPNLLSFLLLVVCSVHAQEERLTMSGVVSDQEKHAPVVAAKVSVAGGLANDASTDSKGAFLLVLSNTVKPGQVVRLRVERAGYEVYDEYVAVARGITLQIALVPEKLRKPAQKEPLTMSGAVSDQETRAQVVSARVTLAGGLASDASTDSKGAFLLTLSDTVRPGQVVRLRVEKNGYEVYDENVAVARGITLQIALTPEKWRKSGPKDAAERRDELEKLYEFGSGWVIYAAMLSADPKDPGPDFAPEKWMSLAQQLSFQLNDRLRQYSLSYEITVPTTREAAHSQGMAMVNMVRPIREALVDRRGALAGRAFYIGVTAGTYVSLRQLKQNQTTPEEMKAAMDKQISGLAIKPEISKAFLDDPIQDKAFEAAVVDGLLASDNAIPAPVP